MQASWCSGQEVTWRLQQGGCSCPRLRWGACPSAGGTLHAHMAGEPMPRLVQGIDASLHLGQDYDSISLDLTGTSCPAHDCVDAGLGPGPSWDSKRIRLALAGDTGRAPVPMQLQQAPSWLLSRQQLHALIVRLCEAPAVSQRSGMASTADVVCMLRRAARDEGCAQQQVHNDGGPAAQAPEGSRQCASCGLIQPGA